MKLLTKKFSVLLVVLAVAPISMAFSLLGPYKSWQVTALGYNLPGDIGGPMNLNEGYRWNVPTVTYAFDATFVSYFGTNGIAAVEKAIQILNDLPPAASITNDGSSLYIRGQRVPFDPRVPNFSFGTLGLLDLKSVALHFLVEEQGLAEPDRWVWGLRSRITFTVGGITYTNYTTRPMSFDPITLSPSRVVNNRSYGYTIFDPFLPGVAAAIATPSNDPGEDAPFSAVASLSTLLAPGVFFIGLSHDDVGGLRYLYDTNNIVTENLLPTVAGGAPVSGSFPWAPYFVQTNAFVQGSNFTFRPNVNGTNLIVQGLRPGVSKLHFKRVNFDSLIGSTFVTITNLYTDTTISNARPVIQPVQRLIRQPDILFVAADNGTAGGLIPITAARTGTTGWLNNDAINGVTGQGGPGVITPQVQISFSDQLPYFLNSTPPPFLTFNPSSQSIIWASFDGTTNAPILYPAYGKLTLTELQNFVLGK
jgi:hypothetical protein